ncbi:transglycosylase domain-containing protein [Erythrobacter sp.]|uniref:transglycosylase domain-containing protein n=1 Tax=Erythrobacter sp. TaxID=1042 RepID=UPI001425E1A1|nr:transglycosylase domain-containing protein [Erythrobacter sp.]QIQ86674.1 MAG: penicillin-binding protein [Erythrobacter sp.]
MGLFERFRKGARTDPYGDDSGSAPGYFPLYESQRPLDEGDDAPPRGRVSAPDYTRWDNTLSRLDSAVEAEERRRLRWWQRDYWRSRGKLWWALRGLAAALLAFLALVGWLAVTAPLSKSLEPIAAPQVTLLASDGTPIARQGAVVDAPVEIANLPPHVPQAFMAIEDRRFYSHWGIDPRGIARAIWTGNGGGSTITQQLAKFTFLTPEQTLTRKAREALIALWLEAWLTKDEILERYLSNAYFGDNQYGLRAASLHYFYRQPENLKPEQAAMLAGLLQAPSAYAPTKHYDRAKRRMDLVVGAMVEEGYLTPAEAAALPAPRLDVRTRNDLPTGTYFADWALPIARREMEASYSKQVLTTTLDSRLQSLAGRVVARAPLGEAQVALVAMRPTGEVVAMVGGRDYAKSPFNRATQARRQPGSTFKLFVYLAALEAGWAPEDTIPNTAFAEGSYRPENAAGNYSEEITLEQALATSSNVAAVRLMNAVGSERVIDVARALGVTSDLPEGDPSLALGTSTMTLLELTAAYAGVAGNAFPVTPRAFEREEPGWLDWLTTREDSLSRRHHEAIERMLRAAVNRGTGRAAMLPVANYGKTGTTQDYRDALFVGYAGEGEKRLVVGVWVGNDDNSPLNGITGGSLPARIWKDFMRGALRLGGGPAAAPAPTASPDPEGPVQPFDVPEVGEIPLDENGSTLRIEGGAVTVTTEIDGSPVEFRLREDGFEVAPAGTGPPE